MKDGGNSELLTNYIYCVNLHGHKAKPLATVTVTYAKKVYQVIINTSLVITWFIHIITFLNFLVINNFCIL